MKYLTILFLLFISCTKSDDIIVSNDLTPKEITGVYVNFDCEQFNIHSSKGFKATYTYNNQYYIQADGDNLSIRIWEDSCVVYNHNYIYKSDYFKLIIEKTNPFIGHFIGGMYHDDDPTELEHISGRFNLQ